jgi:hypothetical protein
VKVSDQTASHDLKSLRAALRFYKREVDGELVVPTVTLPSKAPPRTDYFLTRDELAARLRVARRNPQARHVARMLLIGWYTGDTSRRHLGAEMATVAVGGLVRSRRRR